MSRKITLVSLAAMLLLALALSGCVFWHTLTILVEGPGVVTPNQKGSYKAGTFVEMRPTGAEGYVLDHWGGPDGASVSDGNLIKMDRDKVVIAVFTKLKYDLTVYVSPDGSGTVDTVMVMPEKSATSYYDAEHGQTVRVTARPNLGYVFDSWEMGITDITRHILMDRDWVISARFEPAIKVRVLGIHTQTPLANVPVYFDDNLGPAATFADGYVVRRYPNNTPPSDPVTVRPIMAWNVRERHTPASVTVKWPAPEIVFHVECFHRTAGWGTKGTGDGKFDSPVGVAVDAAGHYIYVADTLNNRIQKFAEGGTFVEQWGAEGTGDGQFKGPRGITIDIATGYVYVADTDNHRIQKFTGDGVFVTKWGNEGTGNGQFDTPMSVAIDNATGCVYVADTENHRIQKFTDGGTFVDQWGTKGTGECQFNYPGGIAIDAAGYVYVADTFNNRIQKFTGDGGFVAQWGSEGTGDGQFNYPWGLAIEDTGCIDVVDGSNHRIQKFTGDGTFVVAWGPSEFSSAPGLFFYPRGVAVDAAGNIYVADTGNHRMQVFEYLH